MVASGRGELLVVGKRASLGAEVYSCNCKRGPLMSVNLSRSCPIVLAVSAAMQMRSRRAHLPFGSDSV